MLQLVNHWKQLSLADKEAWRVFARNSLTSNRLGIRRQISGWNMFFKINSLLLLVGDAIEDVPISSAAAAYNMPLTFSSSVADGQIITFDTAAPVTLLNALIYARALYRSTEQKFNRDWRFVEHSTGFSGTTLEFTTSYEAAFPAPLLGQAVAMRFVSLDGNFLKSAIWDDIVITTA